MCEQPGEILRQLTGMKYLQGKDIYGSPPSNKRNQSWLDPSLDWQQDLKSYLDFDAAILWGLDVGCNWTVPLVTNSTTNNRCTFQCAQIIKESLDKNYGGAGYWNVVVGESFDVKLTLSHQSDMIRVIPGQLLLWWGKQNVGLFRRNNGCFHLEMLNVKIKVMKKVQQFYSEILIAQCENKSHEEGSIVLFRQ